jgi:hypothetical protein
MNRGTWLALAAIAAAEIGMPALVKSVEAQVARETGVTTVAGVAMEYRCTRRRLALLRGRRVPYE